MKKVKFGSYWKNNAEKKEPLKWFVLAEKDGKTLLLSKYALDCKSYHKRCSITTWENCDLRKWLNYEFINNAFSEEEQQSIIPTQNKTNDNVEIEDKVFLLSVEEANKYLTQKTRKCRPTPYAKLHNAWSSGDNFCYWWLRSPGSSQNDAAYVNCDGFVRNYGSYVNDGVNAVRVAMWVDSSKLENIKNS